MPLLYALRNELGLHAAKFGCGLGQCGACTVLLDDAPVRSCMRSAAGRRPGAASSPPRAWARPSKPHPVQAAFIAEQAAQCGYCTNGMVMSTVALLRAHAHGRRASRRSRRSPATCAAAARTTACCAPCSAPPRRRGRPDHGTPSSRSARRCAADPPSLLEAGALVVGFCFAPARSGAGPRPPQPPAARRAACRSTQVDSFLAIRSDGSGGRLLRQGRPRHRPPHRDAPDGRRGARHRRRAHRADRRRQRADAEPGPDRGQHRRHARRRRAAPGRGDGARGACWRWPRERLQLPAGRPDPGRRRSARRRRPPPRRRRSGRRARLRRQDESRRRR